MHDGSIAVADQLIINAVILLHCSAALVGFCVLRVDYCSYGLWYMPQCVQVISLSFSFYIVFNDFVPLLCIFTECFSLFVVYWYPYIFIDVLPCTLMFLCEIRAIKISYSYCMQVCMSVRPIPAQVLQRFYLHQLLHTVIGPKKSRIPKWEWYDQFP